MSERQAFKFYKSYFDVYNELSKDDKLKFIDSLLRKQFYGEEPNLKGMAHFAYLSQKHSIDKQVKGFEDKTKTKLRPIQDPMQGGIIGRSIDPKQQEQEKEQEKEQEQYPFDSFWKIYDNKKGKDAAQRKWNRLSDKDKKAILEHVPKYVKATPDKQFRKHPTTYLNQKTWLDEELPNQKQEQKKTPTNYKKSLYS